jgi:hypothetical protein
MCIIPLLKPVNQHPSNTTIVHLFLQSRIIQQSTIQYNSMFTCTVDIYWADCAVLLYLMLDGTELQNIDFKWDK